MYAFLLGKTPELSIAELDSVFGRAQGKSTSGLRVTKNQKAAYVQATIGDGDSDANAVQKLLNRLGGTTEILDVFAENITIAKIEENILNYLRTKWEGKPGKHNFGINLIPENKNSKLLKLLLPAVKKNLKAGGISVNFMNNNFQNVSPVFAQKHDFIKDGGNISILEEGEGLVTLAATLAFQDIDNYSKRDYSKPFRDSHMGMLPPKLAQMMINLSGVVGPNVGESTGAQNIVIADPFCGSGTILMEAMLMGLSVFGSDIEARMTKGTEQNIEWLRREFKVSETIKSEVQTSPAQDLKKFGTITAIVTEANLGPPMLRLPPEAQMAKTITDLSDLYIKVFKNFAQLIPKGTPIVFIFPYFRLPNLGKRKVSEHVIDKITSLGYSISAFDHLKSNSLFYERSDQIVGREIIRFVKN